MYVNQYFEKNLSTSEVTTRYYLGGKEIAFKKGSTLEYLHTDHLGSTSVTTNTSGAQVSKVAYFPFGGARSQTGVLDTDKRFTGQRLDQTGLYFYNARYYDATIGRFISPDTIVPNPANPQSLNRYSYCLNNPLRYVDPSGRWEVPSIATILAYVAQQQAAANQAITQAQQQQQAKAATPKTPAPCPKPEPNAVDGGGGSLIGWVQGGLDAFGLIPGVGEIADALNGAIYTARGDEVNAALSFGSCVPFVGTAATVGKYVNKIDNAIDASKGVLRGSKTWGRLETLADHFARHGADFGAKNADEYASKASDFLRRSQAEQLQTKIDSNGIIRVYDPQTNTFGAYNPDGTARTFFKPKTGQAYFDYQKGVSPWSP